MVRIVNMGGAIVDPKIFYPRDREASARKVGFNLDNINIVMVSRIISLNRLKVAFDYEKDAFSALEIFKFIVAKKDNVMLHVFGVGEGLEEFKARIARYNLSNNVKLYGYIENSLLPPYYCAADWTFYPHPFIIVNDGTANRESILCETPVIYFKRTRNSQTEHLEGFSVSRDDYELAAHEILLRITDEAYWDMKRRYTQLVPREWTIETFGKRLATMVKDILRHDKTLIGD
jgi:glycosyltransferase involved in cell wall biosynthesis